MPIRLLLMAALTVSASVSYASPALAPVANVPAATGLTTHGNGMLAGSYFGGLWSIAPSGAVTPFSAFLASGEPNLIECPAKSPAYIPGALYAPVQRSQQSPQSVVRISADGSVIQSFATLPTPWPIESLTFDTTGAWGGALYALTEDGAVWIIDAAGNAAMLIQLGPVGLPRYAEGLTIMPKWHSLGPLSGALTVLVSANPPNAGLGGDVIAVTQSPGGLVTQRLPTGLHCVEHLLFLGTGRNLYVASQAHGVIYGIAWRDLMPYAVTVLAVVEDDDSGTGAVAGVYSLRWNGTALVPTAVSLLPGMVAEQMVLTRAGIGGVPALP